MLKYMIANFLDARRQRVYLRGQYVSCTDVKVAIPLGSIVCVLFFIIFMKRLNNNLFTYP